jgi:predicted permease
VFFTELMERLAATPEVAAVSAINHAPLVGDLWTRGFSIEGRPVPEPGEGPAAVYRVTLPGYFDVMRLPIQRGRDFTIRDGEGAPRVVIVSANLARRHWPGEEAIGKRVVVNQSPDEPEAHWRTVVGVVADAARESWEGGRGEEIYLPYLQASDYLSEAPARFTYLTFVARARRGDAATLIPQVRTIVAAMDRGVAIADLTTMEAAAARSLGRPRFQRALLSICALVALLLAAAGIHGVVNYGVARRTREIGLRLALGARGTDVGALVVRQALRHVLVGVVAGWLGTLVLGRLMAGLLHGVAPSDPATLVAATAVLVGVALAASAIPAWRASRVDPVVTMRED